MAHNTLGQSKSESFHAMLRKKTGLCCNDGHPGIGSCIVQTTRMQSLNTLDHLVQLTQITRPVAALGALHVGEYRFSARAADYGGWLLCDGREMSKATYAALYELIGDSFGVPSDPDVFKLPDARGRAVAAVSGARALGAAVGAETHTLNTGEMPSHTHTGTTDSAGAHTHSVTDPGHTHSQITTNDDFNLSGGSPPGFAADSAGSMTWNNINSATTGVSVQSGGAHTHTITTGSAGSGNAFSIMQPTLFAGSLFIFAGV